MGTRNRDSRAIEDLRQYGAFLVDSVPAGRADSVALRTIARGGRQHRSRRLLVVLAVLGLLAVSNVGLASVSDGASPGDFLYPLDRGYEWAADRFGAADRTLERLTESVVLTNRGDTDGAIQLLEEELATPSSDDDLIVSVIEELEIHAENVDPDNQGQGNGVGPEAPSTPATTAPGQVDNVESGPDPASPSDTAPGQIRKSEDGANPANVPPGQIKEKDAKDDRGTDPPGQGERKSGGSPPTSSNGNGNNGHGNDGS